MGYEIRPEEGRLLPIGKKKPGYAVYKDDKRLVWRATREKAEAALKEIKSEYAASKRRGKAKKGKRQKKESDDDYWARVSKLI